MRHATRLAWLGIGVVVLFFVVSGVVLAALLGLFGGTITVHPKGNFSVDRAREIREFPVYYAGPEVNGYRLTAVAHDPLGPLRKNQSSVGFSYGTCEVEGGFFDEGGCSLPVEISNEPACSRNLAMYGRGGPRLNRARVRGTTAAFFDGGSRIEIQTGTTTIVIFAFSKREALEVARNLRGVNTSVGIGEPLPPPARGAVQGKVPCPRPTR